MRTVYRGITLFGLVALLMALTGCQATETQTGSGGINQPAPDFTLNDHTGKVFKLSDHRGKVVLLNFGYTHCPDVCPIALAELAQARKELGANADKVQIVFVTTDPIRDKPQRLTDYLGAFDKTMLGLTGPTQALRSVWKAYNVRVDPGGPEAPTPSPEEWESKVYDFVGHTGITYLIDPKGNVRTMYPSEWKAEKIAADIRKYLGN
jgi:protein SCO1